MQATSLAYSAFFFGESLVFSIIYLYSREVPDQQARVPASWPLLRPHLGCTLGAVYSKLSLSLGPGAQVMLMGLVPVQSFYLPFALTALEFLLGGSIVAPVIGIIAGHTCAAACIWPGSQLGDKHLA